MYQQINATQMFRERQLALFSEAENRRRARRLGVAKRGTQEKVIGHLRRTALLFAAVVMVVLISATAALAEIRVGTDTSETLVGTNSNDHITGKGGNDTLKGLAANDAYHFDDNFGDDTLFETAFVKVGKKKRPGGIDTLNFSQYSGGLSIFMVSQWAAQSQGFNQVIGANGESVGLGTSPVENVVGGSSSDDIRGGSTKRTPTTEDPEAATTSTTTAGMTATPPSPRWPQATTPTRASPPAQVTTTWSTTGARPTSWTSGPLSPPVSTSTPAATTATCLTDPRP